MIIETRSEAETCELGMSMAKKLTPGTVICLDGDLGAGKTVFSKGIALGLGIQEIVNSPTFTILQIYESGRLPLYHFDTYRIEEPEEMYETGFEDYLYGDGVVLVEWSVNIEELIPADAIKIAIKKDPAKDADYRKIIVEGF